MPDAKNSTFFESARKGLGDFVEKAAGRVGINIVRQPTGFLEVHEKTTELLLQAEQDKTFGIDEENLGLDNKDLEMMIGLIQKLEKLASDGEGADSESMLSLIPEEALIRKGQDNYIVEMLGQKIKAGKDKEIDLKEVFRLAKEADQSHYHLKKGEWSNPKDKEKWGLIGEEDRQRIAGMRKVLAVVGLDPDSLVDGKLGVTRFKYVDKKTDEELSFSGDKKVVRFKPVTEKTLINPRTGEKFIPKKSDILTGEYKGELEKDWPSGRYVVVKSGDREITLRIEEQMVANEAVAITANGERISAKIQEETESIFPKTEADEFQEISLRQLLINITRKRQGELADAYLTVLINRGRRIGFQEDGAARGIVVEGVSPGGPRYETLMTALHRGGVYDKWRSIATLSEQNDRFLMLFEARNRDDAQKSMEGGKLSRLASADNIADWMETIPDMAAVLSWQEWQGFRHPQTGEPVDYPAVRFDDTIGQALRDRLAKELVSRVITSEGTEVTAGNLRNYLGKEGDIFVLKQAKSEHKSMAMINVLKERARYLGVETYVVDLAFAFHRVMFTGQDKGISYNKAMTVGDFWQVADMVGLGEQVREDYQKLTKKEKIIFEKAISQASIFQTGVNSFFYMVFGMRDQNTMNRDRYFRQAWKDRAPVYDDGPPDLVKDRISWSDQVNWEVESTRRETYRWMGEFMYTIGKGLKDVAGKFSGTETPFNWQNQHHMEILVNHLLTSEAAAAELRRVGVNPQVLTRPQLEGLIRQIFTDRNMPEAGATNFLGELKKFDDALGYERATNAQEDDFKMVEENFREAVALEKALESSAMFGNLLEFTAVDGWSPNQDLIEQIRGFGGVINEGSYDRMVHNMLYWYKNYLIIFDNFIKLRLGKEPASVENIGRQATTQWQDQDQQDVRGTPVAFLLHYLNRLNEEFVKSDIRDKQLSHDQLNKLHDEHRFWRDAVLFYDEPELDPEKYEAKVKEYCRQRMLELHVYIDDNYIELLRKNLIQLQQVKGLVDPDGQTKMFKFAVRTADGKIVGPGEDGGQDSDEYLRAYLEAQSGFYKEASELDVASLYYQLDMSSTWTPEVEVQTVSKDGQGLYKHDILHTWFGVVENDAPLYNQTLAWYKQLRDLPREAWEAKEEERYTQIPEILAGFAREYLEYEDGRPIDLRSNDPEAEACRIFFRKWLYLADVGGYQQGYTEILNAETGESDRVGTVAFNKAFQVLMPFIWTRDVGGNGIPDDRNQGPSLDAARYFLYLNQLKGLVANADNPDAVAQRIGFYDYLMSEGRVGKQTWAKFFIENKVEWLADKMTIVEKMGDLIGRDKMFSPLYNQYGEVIQQWLGIDERPDAPNFDMAVAVERKLRRLIDVGGLNEDQQIVADLTGKFLAGEVKSNDIRAAHKYIAENHGLKILPRGYWLTQFFRKIKLDGIGQILREKLPPERQARRWVFVNFGVDIGDSPTMSGVYQAIRDKVPHKWRNFENPNEKTYFKILGDRKDFKWHSAIRFAFGKNWLDETFLNKPHYDAANQRLSSLHERILLVPADSYFGVLRRAKFTAQNSMYFFQLSLIAGQLSMSEGEKVKMYEELRGMIPPGKYSWELLEKSMDRLFGFGERQLDFNTDFWLTLEHVPMPVLSLISGSLASLPPLKGLQWLDGVIKKYVDAPWGAAPAMVATVGIPLAVMANIGFATIGGWGVVGILLAGYELANVAARIYMPIVTKAMDRAKTIEWHPKVPFLYKMGVLK